MEINEASWVAVVVLEENVSRELVVDLRALLPVQLVVTRLLFSYFLVYRNFLLAFPFFLFFFFFFFFEGAQCVFGLYILTLKQSSCPVCFWALNINYKPIFSLIICLCHCSFYFTFDGCSTFLPLILGRHLFDLCLQRSFDLCLF